MEQVSIPVDHVARMCALDLLQRERDVRRSVFVLCFVSLSVVLFVDCTCQKFVRRSLSFF